MLKTDTDDTGDFQKHDKTAGMKSIRDLEKCCYFMKTILCLSATENNTKRNDGTRRKHKESVSVTPKELLPAAYDTQIKIRKSKKLSVALFSDLISAKIDYKQNSTASSKI